MVGPHCNTGTLVTHHHWGDPLATTSSSSSPPQQNRPKIVCVCGRTFSYRGSYRYHLKWECGRLLTCSKCNRVFTHKSNLNTHNKNCGKRSHEMVVDADDQLPPQFRDPSDEYQMKQMF